MWWSSNKVQQHAGTHDTPKHAAGFKDVNNRNICLDDRLIAFPRMRQGGHHIITRKGRTRELR